MRAAAAAASSPAHDGTDPASADTCSPSSPRRAPARPSRPARSVSARGIPRRRVEGHRVGHQRRHGTAAPDADGRSAASSCTHESATAVSVSPEPPELGRQRRRDRALAVEQGGDRRAQRPVDVTVVGQPAADLLRGPGSPAQRPAQGADLRGGHLDGHAGAVCRRRPLPRGRRPQARPPRQAATRSGVHSVHRRCPQAVDSAAFLVRRVRKTDGRRPNAARHCRSCCSAGLVASAHGLRRDRGLRRLPRAAGGAVRLRRSRAGRRRERGRGGPLYRRRRRPNCR